MGCLRFLCKSSAYLVAFLAILIGILLSGVPGQLGLYKVIDASGGGRLKGLLPILHQDTPFGFDIKTVPGGSLKGQTYLVTGANVGLGYWSAYHLASKGGHTIMACRSLAKCETAKKEILKSLEGTPHLGSLECGELDLGSLTSVNAFATSFTKTHEKLDSLILNAGVMMCPFTLTEDGLEKQIGTNHFGHFYLVQRLLDTLTSTATSSHPTTISVVSSAAHYKSYPEGVKLNLAELNDEKAYDPSLAYGQSKLSNVLFAQELAERVKEKNILVNVIHPGVVATDLSRHIRDRLARFLPVPLLDKIRSFLEQLMWDGKTAAYTQLYVAIGKEVLEKKITGKYWHPIARETTPHPHALNGTLQKEFWKLTEKVLKEKGF